MTETQATEMLRLLAKILHQLELVETAIDRLDRS